MRSEKFSEFIEKVTESFAEKSTITLLTGESKQRYHQKQLAQSPELNPPQPEAKEALTQF